VIKIIEHTDPWLHYELQEIFQPHDLAEILKFSHELAPEDSFNPAQRKQRLFTSDKLQTEHPTVSEAILSAWQNAVSMAELVLPDNGELIVQMDAMSPGFDYQVHTDVNIKYYSMVIYLHNNNNGTLLHDSNSELGSGYTPVRKQMRFMENTAIMFPRSNTSYHSFNTHGCENIRRTVNMVFMEKGHV
jgi:hypothetical protein